MDELVRALNRIGYQAVFLPDPTLHPPSLYFVRKNALIYRGPLATYLKESKGFDLISSERPDIEGFSSSSKNVDAALSFLTNALSVIGVNSPPRLNLSFSRGSALRFHFRNVSSSRVDPATIDTTILDFDAYGIPESTQKQGRLHVAFEYLYSKEIMITLSTEAARSLKTDLALEAYIDLGAQAEVKFASENTITIKSNNIDAAAFAYKAGRLVFSEEKAKWEFYPEEIMLGGKRADFVPLRGIAPTAILETMNNNDA